MIEIICRGKSPSEAKAKCMVAEILLTEKKISTDTAINVLNAIGGIYTAESEGVNVLRKTLYGTLTQDEELNENEKAMLYIKECAESVGLEVIEGKTAFDIQFMAEVMKRLREKQKPCDACEVGNPCLYCKHEFEPQESEEV